MIIKVWYLNRQVLIGVPDDALVFDGRSWVSPTEAEYVALNTLIGVTASIQGEYAIQEKPIRPEPPECGDPPLPPQVTWENYFLCKVIDVEDGNIPTGVIIAEDPTGGVCVCGVTCAGTEIVGVPVYIVN